MFEGKQEYWFFTFGMDHKHPLTGESLANKYVKVPGSYNESRERMYRYFGRNWAFQYREVSDFDGSKNGKDYGVTELVGEWANA